MTVAQNIGVVPRLLGWDAARMRQRAEELLAMLALDPAEFMDRYPNELSGGQAQRVGVARALAADPPVLLMDEPFGAVDPVNREVIQDEFLRMQKSLRKTVLFVSHDIDEAVKMADRIAIFRAGKLEQFAAPDELLARPANDFVAGFVGSDRTLKRLRRIRVADVMIADGRGSRDRRRAGGAQRATTCVAWPRSSSSTARTRCAASTPTGASIGRVTRAAVADRLGDMPTCRSAASMRHGHGPAALAAAVHRARRASRSRILWALIASGMWTDMLQYRKDIVYLPKQHLFLVAVSGSAGDRFRHAASGIWLSRPWMARLRGSDDPGGQHGHARFPRSASSR